MSTPNPYDPLEPSTPDRGFLPPDEAFREIAPAVDPEHDPLVNPVAQGLNGWFFRIGGVLGRGRWQLAGIFALTQLLPTAMFGLLVAVGLIGVNVADLSRADLSALDPAGRSAAADRLLVGLVVAAVVFVLAVLLVQMLGYAAATYLATRQAAGLPVTVGAALRHGVRRMAGLTAWHLLAYLLVGIGLIAVTVCCVRIASVLGLLPALLLGAYLLLVIALLGPAYLFERSGPLRRSSSLLHAAFWPTAGRLLLLGLTLAAGSFVETALDQLVGLAGAELALPLGIAATVVAAAVDVPLTMVLFSGILITYAERRGAEDTVSAVSLAQELDR